MSLTPELLDRLEGFAKEAIPGPYTHYPSYNIDGYHRISAPDHKDFAEFVWLMALHDPEAPGPRTIRARATTELFIELTPEVVLALVEAARKTI